MTRQGVGLSLSVCVLLAVAACGEKTKGGAADAGNDAGAAPLRDGGPDGSASADAAVSEVDVTMPLAVDEELQGRMRHLIEALAQGNPDLATDIVFPREAYLAVRDSANPDQAWEKSVSASFKHAVERTHKRTKGIEGAKFVSFELGRTVVQLTPKRHEFKKPLWRVKHSKLTFTIEGKTHTLDIQEMTGWRGAWYITRLR